jgi:hypothetical protein
MENHFKFDKEVILYGRNNATGNPTKNHIINEKTGKSFCGFDDYLAEIRLTDSEELIFKPDLCKKCLTNYNKK